MPPQYRLWQILILAFWAMLLAFTLAVGTIVLFLGAFWKGSKEQMAGWLTYLLAGATSGATANELPLLVRS